MLKPRSKTAPNKPVMSAVTMQSRVLEFAQLLEKSERLSEDTEYLVGASKDVKRGAFLVMLDMREALGDKRRDMPVPYSEGGNNPDIYPIEGTKRKGSFYNDLADSFGKGKAAADLLRNIRLASKDETAGQVEKAYVDMLDSMDAEELMKLKRNTEQTRTYFRGLVYDAAALDFQLDRIREMKFIKVSFAKDGDDYAQTPYPIIIRSADVENEPSKWKAYSVAQVLNMDVEKAKKDGGTYDALRKTLRREKKAQPEREALTVKTTAKELEYINQFLNHLEDNAKDQGVMYKELGEDDDLILNVFRLHDALDKYVSKPELQKRYAQLEADLSANGSADEEETEAA